MTRFRGRVVDAGGGQVTVTVDRATDDYPAAGTEVDVTYTTPTGPTCERETCTNPATHDGALPVAPAGTPRAKACPHHLAGLVHVRHLDPAARVIEWLDSDDGSYLDDTVHDMVDDLRAVLDELKAHRATLALAATLARDLGHRSQHLAWQLDNPADLT